MEQVVSFKPAPTACEYLPGQQSQLYYELSPRLTTSQYTQRLKDGWRRFGPVVFRPECPACRRCQSLRVHSEAFRPSRSQRRVWERNAGTVALRIEDPVVDSDRLELFARFHEHGHRTKGWPAAAEDDLRLSLYVANPIPTEEWSYWINGKLVGLGYVDALPEGLSAIYFVHAPEEHRRSLGTFNILTMIDAARQRGLPYVYLGYYVEGCRSLEYKARFTPHEVLNGGAWTAVPRQPKRTALNDARPGARARSGR